MTIRLPKPGSDSGHWGTILNYFLQVSHNNDGTLKKGAIQHAGGVTSINGVNPSSGNVVLTASHIVPAVYSVPAGGIPESDLASSVQSTLNSVASRYTKPSGG